LKTIDPVLSEQSHVPVWAFQVKFAETHLQVEEFNLDAAKIEVFLQLTQVGMLATYAKFRPQSQTLVDGCHVTILFEQIQLVVLKRLTAFIDELLQSKQDRVVFPIIIWVDEEHSHAEVKGFQTNGEIQLQVLMLNLDFA